MSLSDDHAYCADQVRRHDNDRFATALFAPDDRARADLMALYAFNLELARVAETVSEPILGEMRLQWWRDALDGIMAGTGGRHAVATALGGAVSRAGLTSDDLERLIDARSADLADEPPADLAALEVYADKTSGHLNGLALRILGDFDEDIRTAARESGVAWGLIGIVRGFPFHAASGRRHLPRDLCNAASLKADEPERIRSGQGLRQVAGAIVERAREHLAEARRAVARSPKAARPVLLQATLADLHADRLARADMDPFDPALARPPASRHIRLAWTAWRDRY